MHGLAPVVGIFGNIQRDHRSVYIVRGKLRQRDGRGDRIVRGCRGRFAEDGGTDFGFAFGDRARFRVSAFKQKGCIGSVLRQIPNEMMSLAKIGLPPSIKDLLYSINTKLEVYSVKSELCSGKSTE